MPDEAIVDRINALAREEEKLWRLAAEAGGMSTTDRQRLDEVAVALDQCYDLLRQRQARREFGDDPDQAKVRAPDVVEQYEQ